MDKNKKNNNIIKFPRKKTKLEREIEAIIFAADEPLDLDTIEKRVGHCLNLKIWNKDGSKAEACGNASR